MPILSSRLGAAQVALELLWRTITERRMQALAVVDFLQELANRSPCIFRAAIFRAIDFLVFQSFDKALRLRIVVGGSDAAHADADAVLLEFCSIAQGSVMHAAIGVMHQPRFRPATPQRHYAELPAPEPLPSSAAMPSPDNAARTHPAG